MVTVLADEIDDAKTAREAKVQTVPIDVGEPDTALIKNSAEPDAEVRAGLSNVKSPSVHVMLGALAA